MAVSIGITHDINGEVKDFIESSKLKIGLYKSFLLEDFGTDAVKNGTHAWQLAKQINGEISRRSGKYRFMSLMQMRIHTTRQFRFHR